MSMLNGSTFLRVKRHFSILWFAVLCTLSITAMATTGYENRDIDDRGNVVSKEQGKGKATEKEHFKSDELLVKFKLNVTDTEKRSLHAKHGSTIRREFKSLRVHHVKLSKGLKVEEAIAKYTSDPAVEYAEPNYTVSINTISNDPSFSSLWGLNNTLYTGAPDINAPEAWNITTGSSNVVVAVLDTGIDYTHSDLAANMWINTAELNGAAGVDDDGNGYIDDIYGINTVIHTNTPQDDNSHGTHVAGIIGAVGNNGIGITGVNWNVQLMACKCFDAAGNGYVADAIECLQYVKTMRDRGVNIVATNNSWGWSGPASQALHDAIAAQPDILFVAAAGNNGTSNDKFPFYPANYNDLPNVISVASYGQTGSRSSFSNYGNYTVFTAAPGENILSTIPGNNYTTLSGTSMATPHVTGIAALLKAADPTRDSRKIKNLLLAGGTIDSQMNGVTMTGRRADAYGSLACSNKPVFSILTFPSAPVVGVPNTISAISINCDMPVGPVTVTTGSGVNIVLHDDGIAPDVTAGDGVFTGTWTPTSSSVDTLTFTSSLGTVEVASPPVRIGAATVGAPAISVATTVSAATISIAYDQTFAVTGGVPPLTWSLVPNSNGLPPGLTFNTSTGEISGIPTTPGIFNFTVQVTDALSITDIQAWTIFVNKGLRSGWPKVLQTRVGNGLLPPSFSPIFADLNGDGKQEIIVADVDTLYVFDANGLIAKTVLPGKVSTPVVADIDNDGQQEIIVGVGQYNSSSNSIYAFRSDLTVKPGFPAGAFQSYTGGPGNVSSVVAADLDNDGKMELIAVCGQDAVNDPNKGKNVIVMVDYLGVAVPGWPKIVDGAGWDDYPPAVGDIDNDGANEIVFASTDGFVHIFKKDGTDIGHWQFPQSPTSIWPPVLADINGDGFLDIVIRSLQPVVPGHLPVSTIHVYDRSGSELPGWPRDFTGDTINGLAVADLDGDGRPEVIFVNGAGLNQLQVLRSDGSSLPGWPITLDNGFASFSSNPIVGDINGDGRMEVLINTVDWNHNGELLAYTASGNLVQGYPKYTTPGNDIRLTLALGDLDNNGKVDIVVKSEDGMLYVWEEDQVSSGTTNAWPMFLHDSQHTSKYTYTITINNTPFPFTFIDQTNVAINTLVTSNSITVGGINVPTSVTISGGEYEINNSGLWTSGSGTVVNGNMIRVRQTSATYYATTTNTLLTIGGVTGTFRVTTALSGNTIIEDFETGTLDRLPWVTNGDGVWKITSSTVHGGLFAAEASVTITDNQSSALQVTQSCAAGSISFWYSVSSEQGYDFLRFYIDGVQLGAWSGFISWTRQTYPVTAGLHTFKWVYSKDSSCSNGADTAWIDDILITDSSSADTTPDPFVFIDQVNAPIATLAISNSITVAGITAPAALAITGGEYEINGNGLWSSSSGTVVNGNTVRVRQTSSPNYETRTDTVLTIGGVSDTFSVTTIAADTTPDPFTFTDQMNVPLSTLVTSNAVTITGINSAAPISIIGGVYDINNSGIWTSIGGTVKNGDTIRVRQVSSANYSTTTDTILTVGGVSDTFSVTTVVAFTVTPLAGANGSISPSSPQLVTYNQTKSFTVTPDSGYHIALVTGCSGSLNGNTYTTGAVTADCTVSTTFAINTFTVTPIAGANGLISPSTAQTVTYNQTASFLITPNTGYHIGLVTGCSGTLNNNTYTTGPVTADCTVSATFAINTYTVTPSAGANGGISPSTPQIINYNQTAIFTITPNTGYHIGLVTGCTGTLNGNTYTTGPVSADCAVSATFVINTYTVTPSAGANGSISPSTPQTINYNQTVAFTITPNTGYHIALVTGCSGTSNGGTYTTGPVTANCTVSATFAINTYTVTPSAGANGSISPSMPQTVNYNQTPSFTITPNTGYHISLVTGCSGTMNGSTYTTGPVTANCTVSATFAINTYTVMPSSGTNGSISPSTPQTVNYNQTPAFTITPNTGYHIALVTGCSGTMNGSTYTTGPVTANCTVSATFAINTYTVTPSAGANGSISPATPQTVNYNQTPSFTITPNTGYHVALVTGCSGTLSGNTYRTGPVTANCSVSATFAMNTYNLTVTKTGTGSGTVTSSPAGISCGSTCSATYNNGTVVTLTAAPATDSLFAGWSGGVCSGTGTCVTTMNAAKTVTATFTQYLTVTVPNGSEPWSRGSTYTIRWNYAGNPGSNVKIELLKGGALNRTISSSTSIGGSGSGSYSWKVLSNQTVGSDYTIRVTSTSNSNYKDASNANFTIQ